MYRSAVITASDRCSRGETTDESGKLLCELLAAEGYENVYYKVTADSIAELKTAFEEAAKECDLVLSTGGTGLSPRDVTPEAAMEVCERMIPGIAELMRAYSMRITPKAALSRGVAGICGGALIITLPGSVKAVRENFEAIKPILAHAIDTIKGRVEDCGR